MMASEASAGFLHVLQQWLQENGGSLHPHAALTYDADSGVHCRAAADLPIDSTICTIPHSLALSSLNALVDDHFTVFRRRGLPVEAIGYFYLMHQYVKGRAEGSFWSPYLDSLPAPAAEHTTPFYFDAQDLLWLEDTDVLHTTKARQNIYQSQYNQGLALIRHANVDPAPYTWELFMWAATIFTSRSFSSRTLRPQDSKYWTAYKDGPQRRRQTVLLDLSTASAEELDFPVLFPVLDVLNHSNAARASWTFDQGRFSLTLKDPATTGSELFNNYGPKRNDELLLGYGFCLPNNPHDKVLLTLKPPPDSVQNDVRTVQPGYFDPDGAWNSEKATFGLGPITAGYDNPDGVFHELPEPLLELLIYMLRGERGLPFSFIQHPLTFLTAANSTGRQYLPHIACMIIQSLLPKLAKLQSSTPQMAPQNKKQEQAQIYRVGQIQILESITASLRNYLRSLLYPLTTNAHMVVTLEGLLEVLRRLGGEQPVMDFLNGLALSSGTAEVEKLREAGWEDDAFVLLLCFVYSCCPVGAVQPEYLPLTEQHEAEELEQARSALELVHVASEAMPQSFWGDRRWSEQFIAGLGGRLLKYESFAMMVPRDDEDSGDVRLVYYFHG